MGKIRTRILGLENVEEKQKKERKEKAYQKKARGQAAFAKTPASQKKIRAQGLKGGQRMTEIRVKEEDIAKMEKAKKLIEEKTETKKIVETKKLKKERKRGEKYQKAKKAVDKNKKYLINEALKLLKKIKYSQFDESVELHLNVDKVGLRGETELPHATGKTFRVKVVDDKLLIEIEKGKMDFDILITHPSYMSKLAHLAKVLGPKGLMPNPKAGTISAKPEEVAKKFQKGLLRWKTEPKFPLIHQMIGKLSLEDKALEENAEKFLQSVGKAHILSAYIKSTMSPAMKIDLEKS
ncbi:hypothetical protein COS31_02940 [Candidatus Roizmanbacteria bacterium CG02_land_8_20_14_3_00_36_15]|nr:MAG: hypothetical protein COS31_02940 [Candidatus Roizmanbacteria bacterium CG02_land_8_20_14_3_00_36_15]PIY70157.1 MAG: hypothetical protein COY89_02620 [Candidatus Roizmanbacteria bacterium CG_4_10_14_0_8_um_filter_36_36]PJA52899.1 MAG: hypothetical protein CO166_03735 [Candidatus Roizmanbacteria bacterium CG_4_9_14_3_um_filter_36_11]